MATTNLRFDRRAKRAFFVVLCVVAGLVAAALPANPFSGPVSDVVYVVAGSPARIEHDLLLANDQWSDLPAIELAGAPTTGNVLEANDHFLYDPLGRRQGQDDFTVRFTDSAGSSISTVRVVIVPRMLPVNGRWPVQQPPDTSCATGAGSEIGFYLPETERFVLCDFDGLKLRHCVEWQAPGLPGVNGGITGSPRLPLFGDWNDDGFDEPALFDGTRGELTLYDYGTSCGDVMCLDEGATVGSPVGDQQLPLRADWSAGGPPVFAGYDWFQERVSFGPGLGMQLTLADPVATPILGDWDGVAGDRLARWQPLTSTLHVLTATSGPASSSFGPELIEPGSQGNIAFSFRASDCTTWTYFAVLQLDHQVLGLYALEKDRPPVHITVPVDPPDVLGTGGEATPLTGEK